MSKAARSVYVFSFYLFALGMVLLVVPNLLLAAFGIAETHEVWVRVVGMLVLLLGYYYNGAARNELTAFFRWTVHARMSVLGFFIAFAALGLAPPVMIVFGVIDAVAAGWTAAALRAG
jgi:hypothetical protein